MTNLVDDLTAAERFRAIRDRIILADVSDEADLADDHITTNSNDNNNNNDENNNNNDDDDAIVPTPQYLAADWSASKDPLPTSSGRSIP
mmetsp:Transcript_4646/g.13072  ORF Transcript_4646/g.13072 Transcript_4646/m.13072 type:complete len:89 (+) Transcript_4646:279-545(+)